MELSLLVYLISVLGNLNPALGFLTVVGLTLAGFFGIGFFIARSEYAKESTLALIKKVFTISLSVACVAAFLNIILPNEKTAYVMLGAYATQKAAEDPRTQEIGNKVLKIVNSKMDSYIEELVDKKVVK